MNIRQTIACAAGIFFLAAIVLFPPYDVNGTLIGGQTLARLWALPKTPAPSEGIDILLWTEAFFSLGLMAAASCLLLRQSARWAEAATIAAVWTLQFLLALDMAHPLTLDVPLDIAASTALSVLLVVGAVVWGWVRARADRRQHLTLSAPSTPDDEHTWPPPPRITDK